MVDARYDVTNPLQEVQTPGSQPFVKNVAYTLDGLGNRSQVLTTPPTPPSTVTYAADVVNQYTAVGGVARTHDNNGNLKDDGTWVFSYDFENRLVQVRQSGTLTLIADYHYDALGRRVEKVLAAGTTTRYLLDGVEVVEEYDAVGNWQARYVYEDGIDHPRCMDRADIADVNGNQNTTEVLRFHYHQQALGSVTEVTQPTGAVVEWVTYDVYGQPTIRDQQGNVIAKSAIGSPYLYTGREYDAESNLYYYRARHYDTAVGRFLERDPLGQRACIGFYEMCNSRPSVQTDAMGLLPPADNVGPDGHAIPGTDESDPPASITNHPEVEERMTPKERNAEEKGHGPMQSRYPQPGSECTAIVQIVATVTNGGAWAWFQYVKTTIRWNGPDGPDEWSSGWGYDSEGGYDENGEASATGEYGEEGASGGRKNPNHPYYGPRARVGDKIGMSDNPGWDMPTGPYRDEEDKEATRVAFVNEANKKFGARVPANATWVQIRQDFRTYLIDTTNHKVILGYKWSLITTMDANGVTSKLDPPPTRTVHAD